MPAEQMDADVRLRDLRQDLLDGDDLALALNLVKDSLHRRLRRIERSLLNVPLDGDGDARQYVVARIEATLERHRAAMEDESARLSDHIESFQEQLVDAADLLGDAEE